jgi:hypothetical protein
VGNKNGWSAWSEDTDDGGYRVPSSPWASVRLSQEDWAWALSAPLGSSRQVGGGKGLLVVVDPQAREW